jgi:hypothetical protein
VLAQVLPLILLILLGLAGLRGVLTPPKWNGPLHRDGLVIGLALEVVLLVLLVLTLRRHAAARRAAIRTVLAGAAPDSEVAADTEVAGKLRAVLFIVLGGGMIAVAVTLLVGLHLHSFLPERTKPNPVKTPRPTPSASAPGAQAAGTFHLPLTALLYGLLIVLLIAAVVVSIWWARRLRPSVAVRPDGLIVEDPESLREAVESGRTALRALDDARAAIIACYLAMEASLAQRGAARGVAGTPDELLARATEQGLVRGGAAARLTALFYEARFSSHPLDPGQRDAAEQALDELAAALDAAESVTPVTPLPVPGDGKVCADRYRCCEMLRETGRGHPLPQET